METRKELTDKVFDLISGFVSKKASIDIDDDLKNDLGLDSLDNAQLLEDTEREFMIRFDNEEEVDRVNTVGDYIDLIINKLQ